MYYAFIYRGAELNSEGRVSGMRQYQLEIISAVSPITAVLDLPLSV